MAYTLRHYKHGLRTVTDLAVALGWTATKTFWAVDHGTLPAPTQRKGRKCYYTEEEAERIVRTVRKLEETQRQLRNELQLS